MNKLNFYLKKYKESLFSIDKQPLTLGAKIVLFFYLIFVFLLLEKGLFLQVRSVKPVWKVFSYECINLANKVKDNPNYKFKVEDFKYYYNRSKIDLGCDKFCKKLSKLLKNFVNDIEFKARVEAIKSLKFKISSLRSSIQQLEKQYSTMLLEKIANQERKKSILKSSADKVKEEITDKLKKISILENKIQALNNFENIYSFKQLKSFLLGNYKTILSRYNLYISKYRIRILIQNFVFLIPVILFFYFLFKFFSKRNYKILSYLSIHVVNIAGLILLFKIFDLIWDIVIGDKFAKLIKFLSKLNLQFILSIGIIVFFIAIFAFIIYKIQSNKIKRFKFISDPSLCPFCGSKILSDFKYCNICGNKIKTICSACNTQVKIGSIYCQNCGSKLDNN